MSRVALEQGEGVGQDRRDGVQALPDGLRAAGQVDYQASAPGTRHLTADHAHRCLFHAGEAHGLGDAGDLAFYDGQGSLGGDVPGPEPRASGGEY